MSKQSQRRKADAKAHAWAERVARYDDDDLDEHRRQAAHAHVMTHHALEMNDAPSHRAAAEAHRKVADMHDKCAEEYEAEEEKD